MSEYRRLAAVDIGTVTTRLLVADVAPGEVREVARSTDITHLGEGLDATGVLAAEAMGRVRDVVARYARVAREAGVEAIGAVATSASRDAGNSTEFLGMLEETGIVPEVVEGAREAELTFAGATLGLDAGRVLVDDIGGGSTEVVFGAPGPRIVASHSIDVGSRRMTERHLLSDPPSRGELEAARVAIATALRPYFDGLPERPDEVVSVAGTATSLVAIELGLAEYDSSAVHGYRLHGSAVSDLVEHLASMKLAERKVVPGLHPDRAGVIVAGALILESVLAMAGADSTLVSEHDILYGILLDTLGANGRSGDEAVYPNWYRRGP